jgi:ABC-type antimicrobial peptide transport system permease subunit
MTAIGVAIALIILLTSVSLGLKENSAASGSIDFWVVPADSDILDPILGSGQTMLGDVHGEIETLFLDPRVKGASPVLNRVVYAYTNDPNETSVVLATGVIPGAIDVMPFAASGFTGGDPYFFGGGWTDEAVINRQMADLLGLGVGDRLNLDISTGIFASPKSFRVVNIIDTVDYSGIPVVVIHISELQYITGNLEGDRADQILVEGPDAGPLLENLYPDHLVLSGSEYTAFKIASDKRILATAAATALVSFILGMLFIGTTMVMSVSEMEGDMAVMSAIGISRISILKSVFYESLFLSAGGYESLFLSAGGGLIGVLLAVVGKLFLNSVLTRVVGFNVSPAIDPMLLVGGFTVSVGAGIFTGIMVALLMKRPDITRAF